MKDFIKKFKFKSESLVVLNAPADLEKELTVLGFKTGFDKKEKSSNTLVFINNNKEFIGFLSKQLKHVEPDSVLWFAYPKGTSKIKQTLTAILSG